MLFNSFRFLIFFPVVFLLYWGAPQQFRKWLLLAASYYFYMCWKPEFIVLVLLSTVVDYACGLGMERWQRGKRLLLAVSLTVNLGLLFFFKYFNFFGETLTAFCRAVSIPFSAPVRNIILPVGISFYTFQTLSYTIDVYRGKRKPEHDFFLFALFVSYFPQLVAGPIERAENLLPQLREPHVFCYDKAAKGLRLMVWGFFKKCVAAAYLAKLVDPVFENVTAYSGGAVALAAAAFALQIYCDFGGYSDIARGCSGMMGVELMVNFRAPYFADSIQDFWRRWHISLTSWFREYVYIPLGGNRNGFGRKLLNTWLVFFLSGLWHGANWTFVVWGLLQALYISMEQLLTRLRGTTEHRHCNACAKVMGTLKTFVLASFSWIFFRADTMADVLYAAKAAVAGLLHPRSYVLDAIALLRSGGSFAALVTAFAVLVLFAVDWVEERTDAMVSVGRLRPVVRWPLYVVFLLVMILLIPKTTAAPFIYFQF